jgi:hypothetical protein
VIKSLFLQRNQEIKDYFKETGLSKVNELNEIIDGITKKIDFAFLRKEELNNRTKQNVQKLLVATNDVFVKALEQDQAQTDTELKKVDAEVAGLKRKEREILNQIDSIKKAYSNIDAYERISNISNDELTEMYHLYLEKIEYYPITPMKGFYKVQFKSGHSFIIAITKVRCSPQAFLINGNGNGLSSVDLDTGDIHYNYEEPESISTGINDLNFGWKTVSGTVNIRDFFKEDFNKLPFALEIGLDLSYRQRYKEQLDKVTKQKKQPSQT